MMSVAEVGLEPRRSLRRSVQDQKQSSVESLKPATVNGKKRTIDEDDAPVLDGSFSDIDEEEEEPVGPPPLKKVARTSGGGAGAIQWKTATGTPKQLAFKKVATPVSNGSNAKSTATSSSVPPINLATVLAGLLPEPIAPKPIASPSLITAQPKRLLVPPKVAAPRFSAVASTPNIVRRRTDQVNNEVCTDCVKVLPTLRRSLGRLETRMEAVTAMIKQIVNKHSQQNVAFARPATSLMTRPGQSAASSSSPSTSANGSRVAGKPTAMRFVPVAPKNTTPSPAMRKFVSAKSVRLTKDSFMYRMISRGLLTYRSASLTTEEYYKQAPNVIKAHSLEQVQQVMEDLVASGLYKKSDPSVDTMDPECIFEKESELSNLGHLPEYGVNTADFLSGCFDD